MTPSLAATLASRLFAYRWWFLVASLTSFGVVFVVLMMRPALASLVVPLFGPFVVAPWGLLCACTWFHPERGNMRPTSRFMSRLPSFVQAAVRWYASLFLGLFFVVGLVAWPALALAWL
jgi:hypothetical protein